MIYGHFFKLDRDSILSNEQVIFRYLPVRCKSDKGKDEYPYYPVYAVLGRYTIDFFYHGKDYKNDRHVHIRLLHLPLSLNLSVKDNLTSILQNDVYDGKYEISSEYETDLKDDKIKTYWNWEVFEIKENKKERIYFRKLLLDFIYDFEHTHVFGNSPYYEEAEVRLRENFLFNAIAAKAAYYWDRHNWTQSKNKESQNHPENEKNSKDAVSGIIYAENLATSEKQWLKILRSEPSCEYCSYSSGWFQSVEKEYKDAIFPESKNKHAEEVFSRYHWRQTLKQGSNSRDQNQTIYEKDNLNITRESVRWFLRRYNFEDALRVLMALSKWRAIVFVLAELFFFIILPMTLSGYLKNSILNYLLLYTGGIVFLSILLPALFICKLALPVFGMLMPRLIMAISSAWILFTTTEELYKSSFDVTLSTAWWVVLLIIPVMLFMMLEIRNIAPDVKSLSIFCRCLFILVIGLVYSLLIGIFFINFTANRTLPRSGHLPTFYHELDNKKWENPYKGYELKDIKKVLSTILYNDLTKVRPQSNKGWPVLIQTKIFCFHLDVLPGMVLFRAIFALFIGIFIQLIFEDKPITEPL